jgi:molybdopterin biosynthesis enzyme MoaB
VSIDASFEGSTEFGFRFPAYFRIGFEQAAASVSDAAYNATTWDGVTTTAPSKNAVRDKFEAVVASIAALVDDTAYDATTWNGATGIAPSKNAVRDKFESVIAYVDSAVTGLLDDRGNYNASGNVFPSSGGSGAAGAVVKGDLWTISVAGTLGGVAVEIGDVIRAIVDTPGNTLANWAITEHNFSYVPENSANKSSSISGDTGSTTKYPTVAAVETHTATKVDDTARDDLERSLRPLLRRRTRSGSNRINGLRNGAGWNGDDDGSVEERRIRQDRNFIERRRNRIGERTDS